MDKSARGEACSPVYRVYQAEVSNAITFFCQAGESIYDVMPFRNMTENRRKEISRNLLQIVLNDLDGLPAQAVLYPWRRYSLDDEIAEIIKDYLRESFPNVDPAVVDDFKMHNSLHVSLADLYGPLAWPVSESERDAIMVSAPGFSADGLEAIICVGTQFGRLQGSGACFLYVNTKSVWTKKAELTSWIS